MTFWDVVLVVLVIVLMAVTVAALAWPDRGPSDDATPRGIGDEPNPPRGHEI
ncbi:hypothetical protein ACFXNW_08375 [Nocardia sp. NPDC059180]|uniref:hypothetical protein n=1 Tax=Nocardia sp. NPDC059180 TaxID=3346761 RepID=UPI0036B673EB